MSIALICPGRDMRQWVAQFQQQAPSLTIQVWPDIASPQEVEYAVAWKHPSGIFQKFSNLRCISSLGAGVDWLLADADVAVDIPLVRIVGEKLQQSMAEYVCFGALYFLRKMGIYFRQQYDKQWHVQQIPDIEDVRIGIWGYGSLGQYVGKKLEQLGFPVQGFRRRGQEKEPPAEVLQDELASFLSGINILVCLLPLTPATAQILNSKLFDRLPKGAYLIHAARGEHLVDEDLLDALNSGHLAGAMLDVFGVEPLPVEHPFWHHPKILLTPHCAAITNPASAVQQILENYHRLQTQKPLLNQVDRARGY